MLRVHHLYAYAGRFTTSEIVTIYVDPKRKKFMIHKDLLCAKSEYFRASLSDNWTEGK